jgi:hypothetical protein
MPDVSRREEFHQLIGLHNVHFVPLLKDGLPYVVIGVLRGPHRSGATADDAETQAKFARLGVAKWKRDM